MKRYLLFGGEIYYADGGGWDFCGDFDSLEEAQAAFPDGSTRAARSGDPRVLEWRHVFDSVERKVIWSDGEPCA